MPLKMFTKNEKPSNGIAGVKHIVGIAAGKGGVGKSTVTANLGRALKKMGFAVGILDTDIYGPSIRKMLPEDRLPGRKGDRLLPALSEGMHVLSLAYFRSDREAAAIRAPIANSVVGQFLHEVDWGSLDFLLIDFPPGTGDIQLTLSQQANLSGAIMVTTPQEVAVMDVRKAMSLFDKVHIPIVGIVENMSYYQPAGGEKAYLFGKEGGARLADEAGLPLLGQIPLDAALCESADRGTSLFSGAQQSPSAQVFMQIAEKTVAQLHSLQNSNTKALQKFELNWKDM